MNGGAPNTRAHAQILNHNRDIVVDQHSVVITDGIDIICLSTFADSRRCLNRASDVDCVVIAAMYCQRGRILRKGLDLIQRERQIGVFRKGQINRLDLKAGKPRVDTAHVDIGVARIIQCHKGT